MLKRYGPYYSSGYIFHIIVDELGNKKSVWEHREIMEKYLNRLLLQDEVVHHKNGNTSDNRIDNLEVKFRSEHTKYHAKDRPPEIIKIICIECGKKTERLAAQYRHHRNQGKHGPFCGKSCAGKWSRRKQIQEGLSNLRRASVAERNTR